MTTMNESVKNKNDFNFRVLRESQARPTRHHATLPYIYSALVPVLLAIREVRFYPGSEWHRCLRVRYHVEIVTFTAEVTTVFGSLASTRPR